MLGMTVALGVFAAFIGFNVCHDAIHGSFSKKSGIIKGLSYLFYLIGANPYLWNISHNIVLHTYTNIPGHDEDIEVAPGLLRLDESEEVNKIQRYQHLYAFGLYGLASLSWVLRKDYVKFFQGRIGQHSTQHPKREYFNLFVYKTLHYFLFIGVPMLVLNLAWWQAGIGVLVMHVAEGLVMGLVFQLAHVVEGTDFPVPNEEGNVEEAWVSSCFTKFCWSSYLPEFSVIGIFGFVSVSTLPDQAVVFNGFLYVRQKQINYVRRSHENQQKPSAVYGHLQCNLLPFVLICASESCRGNGRKRADSFSPFLVGRCFRVYYGWAKECNRLSVQDQLAACPILYTYTDFCTGECFF